MDRSKACRNAATGVHDQARPSLLPEHCRCARPVGARTHDHNVPSRPLRSGADRLAQRVRLGRELALHVAKVARLQRRAHHRQVPQPRPILGVLELPCRWMGLEGRGRPLHLNSGGRVEERGDTAVTQRRSRADERRFRPARPVEHRRVEEGRIHALAICTGFQQPERSRGLAGVTRGASALILLTQGFWEGIGRTPRGFAFREYEGRSAWPIAPGCRRPVSRLNARSMLQYRCTAVGVVFRPHAYLWPRGARASFFSVRRPSHPGQTEQALEQLDTRTGGARATGGLAAPSAFLLALPKKLHSGWRTDRRGHCRPRKPTSISARTLFRFFESTRPSVRLAMSSGASLRASLACLRSSPFRWTILRTPRLSASRASLARWGGGL